MLLAPSFRGEVSWEEGTGGGAAKYNMYISLWKKGKKYFQTGGCEGKRKVQLPLI